MFEVGMKDINESRKGIIITLSALFSVNLTILKAIPGWCFFKVPEAEPIEFFSV